MVVDEPGLEPADRLAAALDRIDVWEQLAAAALAAGVPPEALPIVIVPELGAFAVGSPAATDPTLVEALIDLLCDRGYCSVVVGGGADSSAAWAGNRTVYALTDLLGFRFVTPAGHDYDIVDLAEDLAPGPFRPGDVLAETRLSRAWIDAGYRIVFATNATDEADGYALGLRTVMRALPMTDEDYVYRLSVHPGDVVAELVRATPVHLALIDGVVSCHGSGGTRAPKPIVTNCIIAATDIWLADTIGAIKMGLDPGVSPLAARSPWLDGAIGELAIEGSLATYGDWISPQPMLLDSARRRNASPWWSRLLRPWLQVLDAELFPLESPLDATLNERLAPWFADVDADGAAFAALAIINLTAARLQEVTDGYRALWDKDQVRRVDAPLGFDPDSYPRAAYDAIVPELRALHLLLQDAPERRPGLRWRYFDRAVLFDYRREIPIDFDEFVTAVDVSAAISYMNDYIGGVAVPVEHDSAGRPVRQAERNLYLPQPNYLVLSGGEPIDVSKLEVVEYVDGRHTLFWKTIGSDNGSAEYDDGMAIFERVPDGTAVTIFGRQQFVLPPLWRSIDHALNADLKDHLVTDAYVTFFDRTLANLEALAEGRDIRIGRPWGGADEEPPPSAALEALAEEALDWLGRMDDLGKRPTSAPARGTAPQVDSDGFVHFTAPPRQRSDASVPSSIAKDVVEFWTGLLEAGLRDLGELAQVSRR